MKRINGLPVYAATLAADADGVLRVSLVDDPAVQSNFDVFRRAAKTARAMYAVADEDRHLVRGVVLRADFPLYRKDTPEDPGYYVIFSAAQIRAIAEKYIADGRANAVDTDHDGQEVDGVQMVQLFLKDTAAGVNPEGFDDIADGSLFAEYHVTNDDVWEEIKAGTYKGFSVEIFYTLVPMSRQPEPDRSALDRLFDKIQDKMSFARFKERLAALLAEPLEPEKFGSVTTDKGVLHWDGDEDLKAGDRVEVEDADGNRTEAPDGDYTTGDAKVIVVVDGAVSEIKDPEAEVATEEPVQESAEQMARQRGAKYEESYDEKSRMILGAIRAARGNREDDYGYLVDAGDDFGVYAYYGEETNWEDRFVRYSISWNADGEATASDPVDCRPAFVPLDFDDSAAFKAAPAAEDNADNEAQMEAALAAAEHFKSENDTLRARVAELEKQPAAAPAHDSFKGSGPDDGPAAGITGSKGLDRLARIMGA